MKDYLPLLEKTALFEGIGRDGIAAICGAFPFRSAYYPKGSVVFRRDEPVKDAGIVLSGGVRAERNNTDGELRIIARHGVGALFGDVLTVSRARRSPVDVVAAEDTTVLFVPIIMLMRDEKPSCAAALTRLRMNLLFELSEKYWELDRKVEVLRAQGLRAKLARRLLAEREAWGSDSFELPGTRETLAAELGVNRSALSRELGAMRREGLLAARRGAFTLLDAAELRRIAGN